MPKTPPSKDDLLLLIFELVRKHEPNWIQTTEYIAGKIVRVACEGRVFEVHVR